MKLLRGKDLAEFIEERQSRQIRGLAQGNKIVPKLVILVTKNDPLLRAYTQLKQDYGFEISADVEVRFVPQGEVMGIVDALNSDASVHGILVQLPLENTEQTEEVLNSINPEKDIDGLGKDSLYSPTTPLAIDWLLAGYNVDLRNKKICIVGNGRLVGRPLADMWRKNGLDVNVIEEGGELSPGLKEADLIVSATGQPRLIKNSMVPIGAVVVDAGTSEQGGEIVGDLEESVYERDDLTITPKKGGVGPLTIAVLFDNLIRAAQTKL